MTQAIDLFADFAADEVAEQEGTYTTIPGAGDTLFLIARANNKEYNKLFTKLLKRNRLVLDSKSDAAEAKATEIYVQVISETVLKGWQGNIMFKGVPTPYSMEAAVALLRLTEFRKKVIEVAEDFETFKAVKDDEAAKN